jgi:hypothetical protein
MQYTVSSKYEMEMEMEMVEVVSCMLCGTPKYSRSTKEEMSPLQHNVHEASICHQERPNSNMVLCTKCIDKDKPVQEQSKCTRVDEDGSLVLMRQA